jgi:hypothetical protein
MREGRPLGYTLTGGHRRRLWSRLRRWILGREKRETE